LADFNAKHSDNGIFSRALTEVGDNPFLPALNITTSGKVTQYQEIANVLNKDTFTGLIEKVDFSQKKDTIEKVFSITSAVNTFGLVAGIILMLMAMLVVFNTIKLVIDASKEEISTMRLVGASSWFVRSPFIIEGALFGVIAFVICMIATILSVYFLAPVVSAIMPGFNLFSYFLGNLLLLIVLQLGVGVGLGVVASFIVVRKYLKV
jgi:cell division transport system permease protein